MLVRDPEYEEDMIGYREQMAEHDEWMIEKEEMRKVEMGADYVPSPPEEDSQLVIKYTEPPMSFALLMFNEPPYVPCIVCKDAVAQFLDDGNVPHSAVETGTTGLSSRNISRSVASAALGSGGWTTG